MGKNLNKKHEVFKIQLIEVIDEFLVAVENANRAIKMGKTGQDQVEHTFESFLKWILYKRNKKLIEKTKESATIKKS